MGHARTVAVIVAGGTGARFGSAAGKQLAPVLGRPVLGWTARVFDAVDAIDLIVVVCHPERVEEYSAAVDALDLTTPWLVAPGGATRQESVAAGLAEIPPSAEAVVIHDGARPLVTAELVERVLGRLAEAPDAAGVIVGHPSVDTLKEVAEDRVVRTADRSRHWAVQTPQAFRAAPLRAAYAQAMADGFCGTDDAALVERAGGLVLVVEGPRDNIKVTVPEDLPLVEAVLRRRESEEASVRIGLGYDAHALVEGRRFILGGVEIEHEKGLLGHSDADVLAHALADAVLGALREGDIGKLFPDTDPAFAGADSLELLAQVARLAGDRGWRIIDADCVVVLERPKVSPYRDQMRANLARALGVDVDRVGLKATTTEGLGFEGRQEGVGAQAVVLLEKASGGNTCSC
ncbi:MAG: 2-C-methyl-D-erythritol 4-phosphate cytidylyltransferase [Coriobacteriia bacterium]